MADRTIAFVFPGQGSQKVGMLAGAFEQFPAVRDTFSEASQALDYDMWDLIQNGEQEALNMTETAQPVLLTSSVALWRAWLEQGGPRPAVMAGHSLGEFSALVCAGALDFVDAVQLVRQRGRFMQSAVPLGEGAMAAIIGLDHATINRVCEEVASADGQVVNAVNFNSPAQVVIAGHSAAVDKASATLLAAGAKRAMPLPVSAPFHTSLMRPAGQQLGEAIERIEINPPEVPVIHNVHAAAESDPGRISALLVEQIYSPVRWTSCIEAIAAAGATQIVECGPGQVLGGLLRRIDRSLRSYALEDPGALNAAVAELQ